MNYACETNPRYKFDQWLEENPVIPFVLDEPRRPAAFHARNRVKALVEPIHANVYTLSLPDRPAA